MNPIALFIRHKAKPGRRDAMREIWEHYVKPRAAANPGHLEYFFCYDIKDPDTLVVFQLLSGSSGNGEVSRRRLVFRIPNGGLRGSRQASRDFARHSRLAKSNSAAAKRLTNNFVQTDQETGIRDQAFAHRNCCYDL